MLYDVYINKAKELVILQDEETGIWYLDPNWLHQLYTNGLEIEEISEDYIDFDTLGETFKLEVERRNLNRQSKKDAIIDWLYDIISNKVDPMIMQEQTEWMSEIIESMKFREEVAKQKAEKVASLPNALAGMDFTKK